MDGEKVHRERESAGRMAAAAAAFLAALRPEQRARAALDFDDTNAREDWHYIPRERQGLPLKEMEGRQRELAHALLATGLSPRAHEQVRTIMRLESLLAELEGSQRRFERDPELYYLSIFGAPGAGAPWGWRFEGHHISLNNTLVGGCRVAPTPIFFGANPAEVRHGEQRGLRALEQEEDLARALLFDLDGEQRKLALIRVEAPADIITRNMPHVRGALEPEGIAGGDMNAGQRELLRALAEVYIRRLPEPVAELESARLKEADWLGTRFAWAGARERGGPHYYRVQGRTFMAEYDNTQNDANHIHTVWRDLRNDFGEDLLRRHYRREHPG